MGLGLELLHIVFVLLELLESLVCPRSRKVGLRGQTIPEGLLRVNCTMIVSSVTSPNDICPWIGALFQSAANGKLH